MASASARVTALETKVSALEARLRAQAEELEELRRDTSDDGDDSDEADDGEADDGREYGLGVGAMKRSAECGQHTKVVAPAEAIVLFERAISRMTAARPHAMSLERSLGPIAAISTLQFDLDNDNDGSGAHDDEKLRIRSPDADQERDAAILARARTIGELRAFLMHTQKLSSIAASALGRLVVPEPVVSRAGYMKPLGELIGMVPDEVRWQDEWVPLNVEAFRLSGRHEYASEDHVRRNDTIARLTSNFKATIDGQVDRGWPRERAEQYCLLGSSANAISHALREGSARYAASTYTLCHALWQQHSEALEPTPPLYWHRRGKCSLTEDDPAWDELEVADATGHCGVLCHSLILADRVPYSFVDTGYAVKTSDGGHIKYEPQDSVSARTCVRSGCAGCAGVLACWHARTHVSARVRVRARVCVRVCVCAFACAR